MLTTATDYGLSFVIFFAIMIHKAPAALASPCVGEAGSFKTSGSRHWFFSVKLRLLVRIVLIWLLANIRVEGLVITALKQPNGRLACYFFS